MATERTNATTSPGVLEILPACSDDVDNDLDGLVDFPADPGCRSPEWDDETNPECSDETDNDSDAFADWPADPDCVATTDLSETTRCIDGIDNDGDGLVDFPEDPDCTGPDDHSERPTAACGDRIDNDLDGLIDFPADPGCVSSLDDDELDPATVGVVRSRLLVAVATSRSLNGDLCAGAFTGGDGSDICPGADVSCSTCASPGCDNLLPDDSRIAAIRSALTPLAHCADVELAFARSAQRVTTFACPSDTPTSAAGGWQGGGGAPCDGGFAGGEIVVHFDPQSGDAVRDLLDGTANSPGGGVPPEGNDFELRATGGRPLAGILGTVDSYLADTQAGDPASSCRTYRVLLVADGGETCGLDEDATAAAGDLLAAGVLVSVVGVSVTTPADQNALNAIAFAGGTTSAIFVADAIALDAALGEIVSQTRLVEVCNGVDDDCDGAVDEVCTVFTDDFECGGLSGTRLWSQAAP